MASGIAQTTCVVSVNQAQVINPASKKLLGCSFDGRTSMDSDPSPSVLAVGYYDPATGSILPTVQPLWDRIPLNGVRYPGNLEIYNWNWSYTIGPLASRTPQPVGPGGTLSQTLAFGFDEFMAMTSAKGLPSGDVQIMVNLYPSIGQPNPSILAADWVEYCNAPNDGSNPRGGIDWAALRDSNGHPLPYSISIWNIGNEPWSSAELGNTIAGADSFEILASPIIDSMLAVDPTIKITISAVGNGSSNWNSTILSSSLIGRIYALSSHSFYDEDISTPNPTVNQVQATFSNLAVTLSAQGLKMIIGDQAHWAPNLDPDKAMRWRGAITNADYLLMASQIDNIVLANFWIYGNTSAVWHPIRKIGNNYTLMAAAQLYETLSPVFYDQSLQTTITDTLGAPVSLVRASAFTSIDGWYSSIIVANTDTINSIYIHLPPLSGYQFTNAQLITANNLDDDTSYTTSLSMLADSTFLLPSASLLILKYDTLSHATIPNNEESGIYKLNVYPNPTNNYCNIILPELLDYSDLKIEIYNLTGEIIQNYFCYSTSEKEFAIDLSNLASGAYRLKIINANKIYQHKIIINK